MRTIMFLSVFVFSLCSGLSYAENTANNKALKALLNNTEIAPTFRDNSVSLPALDNLLINLVDKAIVPLYQELQSRSQQLTQSSQTFCAKPELGNLQALQHAWQETMVAWQRTDALLFGPAIAEQRDFHINFMPPKKLIIQSLLKSEIPISSAAIGQAGVGAQGLSTLEYLLFTAAESDDNALPLSDARQILAGFIGVQGKRRCEYLQASSQLLQQYVQQVIDPWIGDNAVYANALRTAVQGNVEFANSQQALDTIVGKLFQSSEKVSRIRLAKPLNATGTDVKPYLLEGWRSGASLVMLRANIEGIQTLLDKGGILQWLRTQQVNSAGTITADALALQLDQFLKLPVPDKSAFLLIQESDGKALLMQYWQISQQLQQLIKQDLARILRVQLGFNDSDGD